MEINKFDIEGVVEIIPRKFGDKRGYFFESYNRQKLFDIGIVDNFVQDNESFSRKGILRGLHFQTKKPQSKLVRVVSGKVLDVAVDLRLNSKTFGKYISCVLDSEKHNQLYIPRGFAHGFVVLSDTVIFNYKCDNFYDNTGESGIIYNDSNIAIDWILEDVMLSDKDSNLKTLDSIMDDIKILNENLL